MGQITSPIDRVVRHTAFDAEVVIHEYTHAVTARRVGPSGIWKPLLNGPPQARAMEEGMSDYFALTLGNHLRRRAGLPENLAYGAWSSGDPVNGRRRRSYAGFSETYQDLAAQSHPQDAGMLWCAALLGMNRRLEALLGSRERAELAGWLLVYQAMPGIPVGKAAPSFLQGRVALERTARAWQIAAPVVASGPLGTPAELARIEGAVHEAFAERGMGRNAQTSGGGLSGLVNNFTV
jgi:extracellular elastinolytic metalloproteinase